MTFFNVTFLPITIETDVITRHYVGKSPINIGDFLLYMRERNFSNMLKFARFNEEKKMKMDLVYLLHIHFVGKPGIGHMPRF